MQIPADSTRLRLRRSGLITCDRERACPGYVLFAPVYGQDAYLVDLDGTVVHQWKLPFRPGLWGYLLPNGNLFYAGKTERDPNLARFANWHMFHGGELQELDWDGNVVWHHFDPDQHHDARRTAAGGALYLTVEPMPADLVERVRGGVEGTDAHGMWSDVIVEVDAAGNRVWEWHAKDHLDPETDVITFNDLRHEWSHGNTVVPLPGGRVLVSFRNISTIGIIDQTSGAFTWRIGAPMLAQQHDAGELPNGNVLVFDNGAYRSTIPMPFSRVVEIDPKTNQVAWSYQDRPLQDFFSPYISGARRLPNGNTLITEGCSGRIFQVTPAGAVVWEFVNPFGGDDPLGQWVLGHNAVFRASHYSPGEIPRLP